MLLVRAHGLPLHRFPDFSCSEFVQLANAGAVLRRVESTTKSRAMFKHPKEQTCRLCLCPKRAGAFAYMVAGHEREHCFGSIMDRGAQ